MIAAEYIDDPVPLHVLELAEAMTEGGFQPDYSNIEGELDGFGVFEPVDLTQYLDGTWVQQPPTLLERSDGKGVFYRGELNWLHGASGGGKTYIGCMAVAQELQASRHVVWVHWEDPHPGKLVDRLRSLGATDAQIAEQFHVILPGGHSALQGIAMICGVVDHYGADLVVMDSFGEAVVSDGVKYADEEIAKWIRQVPRAVVDTCGAGVIVIDHNPMGGEDRLHASGSLRKRAAVTGSSILATVLEAPSRERAGQIKLVCGKDRSGTYATGQTVALVHMRPGVAGGLSYAIETPATQQQTEGFKARKIAEDATEILRNTDEPLSTKQLKTAISIKASGDDKGKGIDMAVGLGWIKRTEGAHNAKLHELGEAAPK